MILTASQNREGQMTDYSEMISELRSSGDPMEAEWAAAIERLIKSEEQNRYEAGMYHSLYEVWQKRAEAAESALKVMDNNHRIHAKHLADTGRRAEAAGADRDEYKEMYEDCSAQLWGAETQLLAEKTRAEKAEAELELANEECEALRGLWQMEACKGKMGRRMMKTWTDKTPTSVGWYATLHCWDAEEGFFPGGHYWDGQHWDDNKPICLWSPEPFSSLMDAEEWAENHDPEC